MIFSKRPKAPSCLTEIAKGALRNRYGAVENQVAWGLQYQAKRDNQNRRNDFQWAIYHHQKVNQLIEDDLRIMTQNHCSFCDIFPLKQS